jgi:hypothetical protein
VFVGPRTLPREEEAMEKLARYIIRASFSQERMTYLPEESKVIYESKDAQKEKVFDALEWLAAMSSHPTSPKSPCPCGYFGDPNNECTCTLPQIQRYRSKISGPLMDRIDIHIEVPAVKYRDLASRELYAHLEGFPNHCRHRRAGRYPACPSFRSHPIPHPGSESHRINPED